MMIRGDCDWGNEGVLYEAEQRHAKYLFKLRQSKNIKALIYTHDDSDLGVTAHPFYSLTTLLFSQ